MSKPTDRAPVIIEGEFKVKGEKQRIGDAWAARRGTTRPEAIWELGGLDD